MSALSLPCHTLPQHASKERVCTTVAKDKSVCCCSERPHSMVGWKVWKTSFSNVLPAKNDSTFVSFLELFVFCVSCSLDGKIAHTFRRFTSHCTNRDQLLGCQFSYGKKCQTQPLESCAMRNSIFPTFTPSEMFASSLNNLCYHENITLQNILVG